MKRFWWVQDSSNHNLLFNQPAGRGDQEAEVGEQVPIPWAVDDHLGGRVEISQTTKVL